MQRTLSLDICIGFGLAFLTNKQTKSGIVIEILEIAKIIQKLALRLSSRIRFLIPFVHIQACDKRENNYSRFYENHKNWKMMLMNEIN